VKQNNPTFTGILNDLMTRRNLLFWFSQTSTVNRETHTHTHTHTSLVAAGAKAAAEATRRAETTAVNFMVIYVFDW
jgi:DNA-binding GntR family transcriptional regulator